MALGAHVDSSTVNLRNVTCAHRLFTRQIASSAISARNNGNAPPSPVSAPAWMVPCALGRHAGSGYRAKRRDLIEIGDYAGSAVVPAALGLPVDAVVR